MHSIVPVARFAHIICGEGGIQNSNPNPCIVFMVATNLATRTRHVIILLVLQN